jgi:signal transduction histidine kinase
MFHSEDHLYWRKDGSPVEVECWAYPASKNGKRVGGVMTFVDITERKQSQDRLAAQAEELARQAEELLRSSAIRAEQARTLKSVLDNLNDAVMAADVHGNFLIWNPATERIMGKPISGLPPEEWPSRYQIYQPDGVTPCPYEDLPLVRAMNGESMYAELFLRCGNESHGAWIEAAATPLRGAQGEVTGGVAVFRDVTQRVIADREIRKLNAELEQRVIERTAQLEAANKELESFTYSVSHDLRAPLRQIAGFASILTEDFQSSLAPEAQRYVSQISSGTQKMSQLINEMLNLSRLERQDIQRRGVSLDEVVAEVISMLQPETQQREIEWRVGPLPKTDCDPVLTRQVFQNLISNALKYSRTRAQAVIEIGQCERGERTAIFVRDNGVGFDMKYAGKLFGAFQRLHRKEDFEGIGIGLATVARIVRKHNGRIWAEAEVDRGATFYFTLDSQEPQEQALLAKSATVSG